MKYMLTKINTRCEVTQLVMAVKLTGLTYKIAIQLPLVAESWVSLKWRNMHTKFCDDRLIISEVEGTNIHRRHLIS